MQLRNIRMITDDVTLVGQLTVPGEEFSCPALPLVSDLVGQLLKAQASFGDLRFCHAPRLARSACPKPDYESHGCLLGNALRNFQEVAAKTVGLALTFLVRYSSPSVRTSSL